MAEGGRPVLLEEEVADPGEGVAADQRCKQPPSVRAGNGRGHERQCATAADEVQAPRRAVAVLVEIVRVELAETGKAGHATAPAAAGWPNHASAAGGVPVIVGGVPVGA